MPLIMSSRIYEKFGLFSTERCYNCIDKNSYENDQENKYEWVRRLDARMKVMNECQNVDNFTANRFRLGSAAK